VRNHCMPVNREAEPHAQQIDGSPPLRSQVETKAEP
jgi:hypothetical protein